MSKKKKMTPAQKASARWEKAEEPPVRELTPEEREEEQRLHRKGLRNLALLIGAILFFIAVFFIIFSGSL